MSSAEAFVHEGSPFLLCSAETEVEVASCFRCTSTNAGSLREQLALRCLRRSSNGQKVFGVWTAKKAFCVPKGAKDRQVTGVVGLCGDGSETGLFLREGTQGLSFILLRHHSSRPAVLREKPQYFPLSVTRLAEAAARHSVPADHAGASQDPRGEQTPLVAAASLRYHTARGPIVAAVIQPTPNNSMLLVGTLEREEWQMWRLGESFAREGSPALYVEPDGKCVRCVRCVVGSETTSTDVCPSLAEASSSFHRVGEVPLEMDAPRTSHSLATVACVQIIESSVSLGTAGAALRSRFFESRGFPLPGSAAPPVASAAAVLDAGNKKVPVLNIFVPQCAFSASPAVICVRYAVDQTRLSGSCSAIPCELQPSCFVLTHVAVGKATLPQQPDEAVLGIVLDRKELKLSAFGLSGGEPVQVSIEGSVSAGRATNQVPLVADEPRRSSSPSRMLQDLKRRLSTGSRKPSAASPSSSPVASAVVQLLPVADSTFLCTSRNSVAVIGLKKVVLATPSPAPAEGNLRASNEPAQATGTDSARRFSSEGELRHAVEQLTTIPPDCADRNARVDRIVRDIFSAIRFVGSSQTDMFLVQETFMAVLHAYHPCSREDWQFISSIVGAAQRSLTRCTNSDGSIIFTDRFFLEVAKNYVERSSREAAMPAHALDFLLDNFPVYVSEEASAVAATASHTHKPATAFMLEALAGGTPLVPFAEEVARRFVLTSVESDGTCSVRARDDCGAHVFAAGVLLLASCLDIEVDVFSAEDGQLQCGLARPGETQRNGYVHVGIHAFRTQREFEYALVLAGDLLSIPPGKHSGGAATTESLVGSPHRLAFPLLTFAVTRRHHCFSAFLRLYAASFSSAVSSCGGAIQLQDNKDWVQGAVRALASSYVDVFRRLLEADVSASSQSRLVTALCYVLCSRTSRMDTESLGAVSTALPGDVPFVSVVLTLFSSTEKLVAAQNNFNAAAAKYVLGMSKSSGRRAEHSAATCADRLRDTLERALRIWSDALPLLPYREAELVTSYRAAVAASCRFSTMEGVGTIISRTLVFCYRTLVTVNYAQQLLQRLDRAGVSCKKASATGDEVSEFHPVVDGCLQALYAIHVLRDDCVPADWLYDRLLSLIEEVTPKLASERSAQWAPYFTRVLELSGVSTTTLALLKKRYYALVDFLQEREYSLNAASSNTAPQQCATKVGHLVDRLATSVLPRGQDTPVFVLSHRRDSCIPDWAESHELLSRKYLVANEWAARLWHFEVVDATFNDASSQLSARLALEKERMAAEMRSGAPTEHTKELSPELQRPLFGLLCSVVPPILAHTAVASPLRGHDAAALEPARSAVPTRVAPLPSVEDVNHQTIMRSALLSDTATAGPGSSPASTLAPSPERETATNAGPNPNVLTAVSEVNPSHEFLTDQSSLRTPTVPPTGSPEAAPPSSLALQTSSPTADGAAALTPTRQLAVSAQPAEVQRSAAASEQMAVPLPVPAATSVTCLPAPTPVWASTGVAERASPLPLTAQQADTRPVATQPLASPAPPSAASSPTPRAASISSSGVVETPTQPSAGAAIPQAHSVALASAAQVLPSAPAQTRDVDLPAATVPTSQRTTTAPTMPSTTTGNEPAQALPGALAADATPVLRIHTGSSALVANEAEATGDPATVREIAWWEELSSAHNKSGNTGDDSREEPAALSDTDTSYTTATSNTASTDPVRRRTGAHHRGELEHNDSNNSGRSDGDDGVHGVNGLGRRPLFDERPARHSGRGATNRCHCRHHCCARGSVGHLYDRQSSRERRTERPRLLEEPESPHVVFSHSRGACKSSSQAVQLLQFASVLRPPSEPRSRREGEQTLAPATARSAPKTSLAAVGAGAQDANGEIPLLSLAPHSLSRTRVRLFSPVESAAATNNGANTGASDSQLPSAASLFFESASARVSTHFLAPPPLPSASVFAAPPPLLRLPERARTETCAADGTERSPPRMQEPEVVKADASLPAFQPTAEVKPYAQVPRDVPEPTETAPELCPRAPFATSPAAVRLPVPDVKEPVLSPSELSDFRRYTDELVSKGTAGFLPVPTVTPRVPTEVSPSAQTHSPPPASREGPCCVGYESLLEDHHAFLQRVEHIIEKHDTDNAALQQRLLEELQRSRGQCGPQTAVGGLTAMQQSGLVQNTIKQKNELMNLNQQLLDMQLRAARAASSGPAAAPSAEIARSVTVAPPVQPSGSTAATSAGSLPQAAPPLTATSASSQPPQKDAAVQVAAPPSARTESPAPPTDERAARSVVSTMEDLVHLTTELQNMNASTDAMEHAIAETRETISRYEACREMDASNAEGAAMLIALRHKTAAAERRLSELTHAAAVAPHKRPEGSAWMAQSMTAVKDTDAARSEDTHESVWLSQSTLAGVDEPARKQQSTATVSQEMVAVQPSAVPARAPRQEAVSPAARPTHAFTGPISVTEMAAAGPAKVLSSPLSVTGARGSLTSSLPLPIAQWNPKRTALASPARRRNSSQSPAHRPPSSPKPRSVSMQLTSQPLSTRAPRPPRLEPPASPLSANAAVKPPAAGTRATGRPSDLSQLYAQGRKHSAELAPQRVTAKPLLTPASTKSSGRKLSQAVRPAQSGAFAMYRTASASAKRTSHHSRRNSELTSAWTDGPTPLEPVPMTSPTVGGRTTLKQSSSFKFEEQQHARHSENFAKRMAQLEADLFS